jgi:hypothetical protein
MAFDWRNADETLVVDWAGPIDRANGCGQVDE